MECVERLNLNPSSNSTKLLVSVRSTGEAEAAILGGADIIDIKEPANGSLGAASSEQIDRIVKAVNDRRLVTAAIGEAIDWQPDIAIPRGIFACKFGLAGGRTFDWRKKFTEIRQSLPKSTSMVAVAYADEEMANSPSAEEIGGFAIQQEVPFFLLDTYQKDGQSVFDHQKAGSINDLIDRLHSNGIQTVLAGTLSIDDAETIAGLSPSIVGVRTAVCTGGRQGVVSRQLVESLKDELQAVRPVIK